jgi:GAF domain-containing protein
MAATQPTLKPLSELLDRLALRSNASIFIARVTDSQVVIDAVAGPCAARYLVGEAIPRQERKQYCEHVVEHKQALFVHDARSDPLWANGLDVDFDLTNYLGYPILAPNGQTYGSACFIDSCARNYCYEDRQQLQVTSEEAGRLSHAAIEN